MTVTLHIEQLVVRGLPLTATDRAELAAALEAELGRLLASAEGGPRWTELGDRPQLDARPVTHRSGGNPGALGRAVAASLTAALGAGPREQGGATTPRPDSSATESNR